MNIKLKNKGGVFQLAPNGNFIGITGGASSYSGIRPVVCLKAQIPAHKTIVDGATVYVLD